MTETQTPIAVLGAGSWGTALAVQMARNGHDVLLWGHEPEHMGILGRDRCNQQFLPNIQFPERLRPESDLRVVTKAASDYLVVVPSHAFRAVLSQIEPQLRPESRVSWATKGLENGALLDTVAEQVLGDEIPKAVVSGPSFALEVAAGLPTAVTVAATHDEFGVAMASYLHSDTFRVYTSRDLTGVELGGAVKNVMAIAAGIADGLGFAANTRSALITRGLAEIMRLGAALGAERETLMGLSGLGDLILTCSDDQSRNRRMGLALAKGKSVEAACQEIGQAVEGIAAAKEVRQVAEKLGIDMPITEQTYRVLYESLPPTVAVRALLSRDPRAEAS